MIESSRFENRQKSLTPCSSLSLSPPNTHHNNNVRLLELLLKWTSCVHFRSPNRRQTATQSKHSLECGAPWQQRCCYFLHLLRNPTPVDRSLSLLPLVPSCSGTSCGVSDEYRAFNVIQFRMSQHVKSHIRYVGPVLSVHSVTYLWHAAVHIYFFPLEWAGRSTQVSWTWIYPIAHVEACEIVR